MDNKPAKVKAIERTVERIAAKYNISDEDAAIMNHTLHSVVESRDRRLRHIENLLFKTQELVDRQLKVTHKTIAGSLKSCIDIHGPITSEHINSAAKRILGGLL